MEAKLLLVVRDVNGRQVSAETLPVKGSFVRHVIDFEAQLERGLYFIESSVDGQQSTVKLIID
jgi:hypothetical protein